MKYISFCVGLMLSGFLAGSSAQAQFFTSDTTIGAGDTNYEGEDIVVLGCTLTVDGTHTFSDVLLVDGAMLTHSLSTNGASISGASGVDLSVQNNLVIDDTSAIRADGLNIGGTGMGYISNIFSLPVNFFTGGGGGHGGCGGRGYSGALGGPVYSTATSIFPGEMGSSGGSGSDGPGGLGGGYVKLTVGGAILLDGAVSAEGGDGTNGGAGGGSGGSISLTAQSIVGAGLVSVNGGDGEGFDGGGGGGGRIIVNCQTNGLTGAITAFGGQGNVGGGAGTVIIAVTNSVPLLLIDNGGVDGTNTPLTTLLVIPNMVVTNGAIAETPIGTAILALRSLVVGSGSALVANGEGDVTFTVSGNAFIASNSGIFVDGVPNTGRYGAPLYAGASVTSLSLTTGGGGGNGGFGGLGATGAAGGNSDYLFGFGLSGVKPGGAGGMGGFGNARFAGGNGGGVISVNVLGTLTVNGALGADGADGLAPGSGGGAGGDIAIQAGVFEGTGSVSTDGGAGENVLGGGGGGGRILIYCPSNQFTGGITAYGGVGFRAGGAGTIFESPGSSSGIGLVTIDAGGIVGTNTPIPGGLRFGMTLLNGARAAATGSSLFPTNLFVGANCILAPTPNLSGQFSLSASPGGITIAPSGAISWNGAGGPIGGSFAGSTLSVSNIVSGGGGAGAGNGGNSAFGASGGVSSGEISQGSEAGSGGLGLGLNSRLGGSAGGRLQIMSAGPLVVDGVLSANGGAGASQGSGGGGGGYIMISVPSLLGAGIISANGGSGNLPYGGGGGGGSLALLYQTNLFTGALTAYGGAGANYGGAGVVALEPRIGRHEFILDNNGLRGTNTPLNGLPFGSDLMVSNGAIGSFQEELSVQNLFIGSNSFLVAGSVQNQSPSLMADIAATIQQGGGIIADGTGFPSGAGPGAGTSTFYRVGGFSTGSGASHGAYGGTSISGATSGLTYDSIVQPSQTGSGGGGGVVGTLGGGAGGGHLGFTVNGLLTLDGVISANGNPGAGVASGGGAGGSILLRATGLAGAGVISANGGSGNLPYGGGGAGGLININLLHTNLFAGAISAHGGPGYVAGGAGLVYFYPYVSFSQIAFPNGVQNYGLLIDNGGLIGTNTPLASGIQGNIASYNLQVSGGAIVQPAKGATGLIVNNLLVQSNGVITQASGLGLLSIASQGSATIGWGGAILVDGKGYLGGSGPGAGGWVKAGAGGGGGHGGKGGNGAFGALGGTTNGSISVPQEFGSGGGSLVSNSPISLGGGAILLSARQNLIIDGLISANGFSSRFPGAGGGAGGSVSVQALALSGNGVITANGGAGDPDLGGGGGGGRVALNSVSNTYSGTISFLGGTGFEAGGIGTLFISSNGIPISNVALAPQVSAELNSAAGALTLRWTGSSNTSYQLYYSTNLIDWIPYGSPVDGSDGAMSLSASCDGESKFFRVVPAN